MIYGEQIRKNGKKETITINNNGTLHIMSYQTVYEHMLIANDKEQKQIKDMIVHIDFMNGDILDYFKHLGKCLTN